MTESHRSVLLHTPITELNPGNNDRTAFSIEGNSISYGELQHTVLQGAAWFMQEGIQPGDRIGICLPKSIDAVQIIFASLAAGAVYVPVDSTAPPARVNQIISDSGASQLITFPRMAESLQRLDASNKSRIKVIDQSNNFQKLIGNAPLSSNLPPQTAKDIALFYYTSGTTGKPKAIMLNHENVSSFIQWVIQTFAISENDRVISHAPFHFDLSTLDLFAATRAGASVVLLDQTNIKFPAKISQIIETEKISIWYSVPTALTQLLRYGALDRRDLKTLRLILFAGEPFPVSDLRKLMQEFPECEFANLYGPTETNVCTYYRINKPPDDDTKDIPIGVPCENLEVRLFQENGTEINNEDTGEIVVFGPSVMQGYWNNPELTASYRFNGDPNSYRTGDFAYKDKEGQLHFIGRKDDQVKIRGHRVELLEISNILNSHPAIIEASVLLSNPENSDLYLLGFIVPEPEKLIDIIEIQKYCRDWLPVYAIPKKFIILDNMPRTTTGKIDRQELMHHPEFLSRE